MQKWTWKEKNGIKYITVPSWEERGVNIAFSARYGGYSSNPFATLNLGLHVKDDPELVMKNRQKLMGIFNSEIDSMVCCQQVHGNRVVKVDRQDRGYGSCSLDTCLAGSDGMVTAATGIYLTTFYADCIPIFLFDPVKKCIGLAHSGWKGTMGRIGVKAVMAMQQNFGSCPDNIEIFIGPGIGPCCFEIQPDLVAKVKRKFKEFHDIIKKAGNAYTWDLPGTIEQMLGAGGVKMENIINCRLCTVCHHDIFYSYRKEQGMTGRMGAVIGLRD